MVGTLCWWMTAAGGVEETGVGDKALGDEDGHLALFLPLLFVGVRLGEDMELELLLLRETDSCHPAEVFCSRGCPLDFSWFSP